MTRTAPQAAEPLDRRALLKALAGASLLGAAGAVPLAQAQGQSQSEGAGGPLGALRAPPAIGTPTPGEAYWAELRRAFALGPDYIHMNTGTTGSQPLFSLHNLGVYNLYKSADPLGWQDRLAADHPGLFGHDAKAPAITRRQAQVAAAYGAEPDEIVLSYNTTDACNLIVSGTPWQRGDRIVTTTLEHAALVGPLAWARDHFGVELAVVEIPSNFSAAHSVDEVLSWFAAELRRPLPAGARQWVAFSEVFYKNGLRMPVAELCALARRHGAWSIVDSAHAWGMLPTHCPAYGADFIAGAGHKWLCGGPGTGILYVRRSGERLPPFAMGNFVRYGDLFTAPSANHGQRKWSPAAAMQGRGETNLPALFAMTDSLRLFEQVGLSNVYDRGVALARLAKQKVAARWGAKALWVQDHPDPRLATFLTAFNPFAARDDSASYATLVTTMNRIVAALAAESPRIVLRTITWRDRKTDAQDNRIGFRLSTHAMYNRPAEIDHVLERLARQVEASGLKVLG